MKVMVNGKEKNIKKGATVSDLLKELDMSPEVVNVQVNEEVIKKNEYSRTVLFPGDEVEILMFMGGGITNVYSRKHS